MHFYHVTYKIQFKKINKNDGNDCIHIRVYLKKQFTDWDRKISTIK